MWILLGRGMFANIASVCAWNPVQSAFEKFVYQFRSELHLEIERVRSDALTRVMSGELRQLAE